MLQKPEHCRPCTLYIGGQGFVPADGPLDAPLLCVGEAPGQEEARQGRPMVGQAGGQFDRILYQLDMDRPVDVRVHNVLSCQPPRNKLLKMPWEYPAIHQCQAHLAHTIQTGQHKAIVAMGAIAARELTGIRTKLEDLHGTWHEKNGQLITVTYHPSHLQRGAKNLTWVVKQDLATARRVAREGYRKRPCRLVIDPPVADFGAWVEQILDCEHEVWCATDIETPYKSHKGDEGQVSLRDPGRTILRSNLAVDPDEGWTVPWVEPYITIVRRLLASKQTRSGARLVFVFWNETYDVPILEYNDAPVAGYIIDAMDACHFLQGDVPRGLGFWAPFYSDYGAWKHLADTEPERYAAVDGIQTLRVILGAAQDLDKKGLWGWFIRHFVETAEFMYRPSSRAGVLIDAENLPKFHEELQAKSAELEAKLQEGYPEELAPLHPRAGWKKDPGETKTVKLKRGQEQREYALRVVQRPEKATVWVCRGCGRVQVTKSHRCLVTELAQETLELPRWYVREPFNPGSPAQVLAWMKHHNHKLEIDSDTGKPTTAKLVLQKRAKDAQPEETRWFYRALLDYREITKVDSTYVAATLRRLEFDRSVGITTGRICPQVTNKPSTFRTAYVNPNLQNVVADKGGEASLAAGFRKYVIAAPGCSLVEADYSAIEAVITGWRAGDPTYIRLAKLSVHAYLASILVGHPADLSWPNEKLLEHFTWIKKTYPVEYDRAKRVVHGTNYGLTPWGMAERFPTSFPKVKDAIRTQGIYYKLAPKLLAWHGTTRDRAARDNKLGGAGQHPFGYTHHFYGVYDYTKITRRQYEAALFRQKEGRRTASVVELNGRYYRVGLGEDAKRCIAFDPQSIAAGVIKECGLRLFKPGEQPESWIGDCGPTIDVGHGRTEVTPLRALIHDSFLLEVRDEVLPYVLAALKREMTRPVEQLHCPEEWEMGPYLSFGCEIKVGKRWSEMEKVEVDPAADGYIVERYDEPEIEDEEEVA